MLTIFTAPISRSILGMELSHVRGPVYIPKQRVVQAQVQNQSEVHFRISLGRGTIGIRP